MTYNTISFYKYCTIKDPCIIKNLIESTCIELEILGRILISTEGINGACSGTQKSQDIFKHFLQDLFENITFREQKSANHTYHKLVIRKRDEIVVFGQEVDLSKRGKHITPKELEALYDTYENFVIVDVRNEYEYNIGKFKNAIKLPITTFKEFANVAPVVLKEHKNKQVILYCTGGVRCEKASAYLKTKGFRNVNQLEGGIINYANQFPGGNWEGGLYVFDDRKVSELNRPIAECKICASKTNQMINCHNIECDALFSCCNICQTEFNNSCSDICKNASRRRERISTKRPTKTVGIVENYYAKVNVALVKVEKKIVEGQQITIHGTTTAPVKTIITQMRDYDGNKIKCANKGILVTFPMRHKVRENDKVVVSV